MRKSIPASLLLVITLSGCATLKENTNDTTVSLPSYFIKETDTTLEASSLKAFLDDTALHRLVDTALANNFDLLAAVQRVEMLRANTRVTDAARFPQVNAMAGVAVDRYGKYTLDGVGNFDTNLSPNIDKNQRIPDPATDFFIGFRSSWEIDIWGKLKDRSKAAYSRFLAGAKGRQWLATQITAEVGRLYYELLSLDQQLKIIQRNIELQKRGLEVVEAQMAGGRATALAVRQFRAQLLHTKETEIRTRQSITRAESDLNILLGRFSSPISRDTTIMIKPVPVRIAGGVPSTLLLNRPDIQQAELELLATKADISAARKAFLPSLTLNPYVGFNAFKAPLLFNGASLAAGVASGLAAPVFNRGALKAGLSIANAEQATAYYHYQQKILEGFQEIVTELKAMDNLKEAYALKSEQVQTLKDAVATANDLYLAGYATYLEVIMAQAGVLQAEMEQVNMRKELLQTGINLYRSLGGGRL